MREKNPNYCSVCGKKISYREDGEGGCDVMDKEHGFCCNNPDCQVDGSVSLQLNDNKCSECGSKCNRCDIIAECD